MYPSLIPRSTTTPSRGVCSTESTWRITATSRFSVGLVVYHVMCEFHNMRTGFGRVSHRKRSRSTSPGISLYSFGLGCPGARSVMLRKVAMGDRAGDIGTERCRRPSASGRRAFADCRRSSASSPNLMEGSANRVVASTSASIRSAAGGMATRVPSRNDAAATTSSRVVESPPIVATSRRSAGHRGKPHEGTSCEPPPSHFTAKYP
mmetsp:Transcript_7466/g.19200  ORF Transcript_7466/g.19200 Transcript_7466/m.19200 type:complete len:206 (+) Transcript_7466:880-1497(+)